MKGFLAVVLIAIGSGGLFQAMRIANDPRYTATGFFAGALAAGGLATIICAIAILRIRSKRKKLPHK